MHPYLTLFYLLSILTILMGRVLIVHFNNRDDTLKIKVNDTVQLHTVSEIIEFLKSKEQLGVKEFKIDLIINGKFIPVEKDATVVWKTNFLSVFVIDLVKPIQTGPVLCISGIHTCICIHFYIYKYMDIYISVLHKCICCECIPRFNFVNYFLRSVLIVCLNTFEFD
jgi:hypothetical protein